MATQSALKSLWNKSGEASKGVSLKQFAQNLLEGEEGEHKTLAMNWFAHKGGALEREAKKQRQKNKGAQLAEIRIKVRAARRNNAAVTGTKPTKK